MMLVEGTSLAVCQWAKKLRDANWALCSSDDGHHSLNVRKAEHDTQIKKLVDNCGSEHRKIWYTVFEVKFGLTSTFKSVWKGDQDFYRLTVVHVNHAIARSACRSCRINFADMLLLCTRFQVDIVGDDFNAFSYRCFRTGSQIAASLQDSSLAVTLRRFGEAINALLMVTYENDPEYQFRSDLYMHSLTRISRNTA